MKHLLLILLLSASTLLVGQTHNIRLEPSIGITFQKTYLTETSTIKPSFGLTLEYLLKDRYSLIIGVSQDPAYAYNRFFMLKVDWEEIEVNEIETNILNFPLMLGGYVNLTKKLQVSAHGGGFLGNSSWTTFENSEYIEPRSYTQRYTGVCGLVGLQYKISKRLALSMKLRVQKYISKESRTEYLPRFDYFDEEIPANVSTLGYIVLEENTNLITYTIQAGISFKLFRPREENCLK